MLVNGHRNEQLGGKYLDGRIGGWMNEWMGEQVGTQMGREVFGWPDSVGLPAAAGPGDRLSPSGPPPSVASCPPRTAAGGSARAAASRSPVSACPRHPSAESGHSEAGCGGC